MMEMIENWKNDEQAEQNNVKVPVDFTSQNEGAQGMWCFTVRNVFFLAYHTCLTSPSVYFSCRITRNASLVY